MSMNMGLAQIFWNNHTNEYSPPLPSVIINSEDPNEPYETGHRNNHLPFPEIVIDEEKYKEMCKQFFSDGPKLKFIPSEKFINSIFGYIFQMGPKGLGYYIDPFIMRHVIYR